MSKPKVFIGSSSQGLCIAQAIQANLAKSLGCVVTVWSQGFFGVGEYALRTLLDKLEEYDFSIFVFRADDPIVSEGKTKRSPRGNVLFEFGICSKAHGLERAFVVYENDTDTVLLSDLKGLTLAEFPKPYNKTLEAAMSSVGPACATIAEKIGGLGFRSDVVGSLEVSFPSRNLEKQINEFSVGLLKPERIVTVRGDLFAQGAEALANQIRRHTAAVRPDLIVGVNQTGIMLASYLDGVCWPGSPRPIGTIKTGGRVSKGLHRHVYPCLPSKEDLSSVLAGKPIESILVVDGEYKTGSSLRQVDRFLEERYGVAPLESFKAVLCLCGIDKHHLLQENIRIEDVLRKSRYTERGIRPEERAHPDFVAFIASGSITPFTGN